MARILGDLRKMAIDAGMRRTCSHRDGLKPGSTLDAHFIYKGARRSGVIANLRRGFILLEVMVALTLLALVLTPLAAMVFKITSRSSRIVGSTYRNAVLLDEVNYIESLAYDSLATGTTTTSVSVAPYPHTRTVVINEVWKTDVGKLKRVKIVITPTNALYRPDTAQFMRSVVTRSSVFTTDDQ